MVIKLRHAPSERMLSQAKAFPSSRTCLKLNIDRTQQPPSLRGCQADLSRVSHMKAVQDFPSTQAATPSLSAIIHVFPHTAARGTQLHVRANRLRPTKLHSPGLCTQAVPRESCASQPTPHTRAAEREGSAKRELREMLFLHRSGCSSPCRIPPLNQAHK